MSNRKNKSTVRPRVIEFIKSEMDSDFTFEHLGDMESMKLYIRAMRTELSRLREKVKSRGKVPKHFKMLVVSQEEIGLEHWRLVLRKSTSSLNVDDEIDEIMEMAAGGRVL